MPTIPSIKGAAVVKLVEDVGKLLSGGALSRSDAERWLVPEDFPLLEREVSISGWYDVRAYARLSQLLLEVEGGGNPEFLRERGRQTARRLLGSGLYSQFEYLQRTEVRATQSAEARFAAFGRDLRLLTSLSGSMLNFTKWTARPDPDHARRYRIEVSEARDYPEALCWSTDGFVNQMAEENRQGTGFWSWERPQIDRIVFRMRADL